MADEFDLDHNRVAWRIETELLDRMRVVREINKRMTEAFLDANKTVTDTLLGDLDNWRPVGILNATAPRVSTPESWSPPEELDEALREHLRTMMIDYDREAQNARALTWWRSQHRMTIEEASAKIRTEYGGALDLLGRL